MNAEPKSAHQEHRIMLEMRECSGEEPSGRVWRSVHLPDASRGHLR